MTDTVKERVTYLIEQGAPAIVAEAIVALEHRLEVLEPLDGSKALHIHLPAEFTAGETAVVLSAIRTEPDD